MNYNNLNAFSKSIFKRGGGGQLRDSSPKNELQNDSEKHLHSCSVEENNCMGLE